MMFVRVWFCIVVYFGRLLLVVVSFRFLIVGFRVWRTVIFFLGIVVLRVWLKKGVVG